MLGLVVLLVPKSPKVDFARCVRALAASPSYAVRIEVTTKNAITKISDVSILTVRSPHWLTLELSTPQEAGHGALDWACDVHGRSVRAYDVKRRAVVRQTLEPKTSASAGLAGQFGAMIPEPVQRFLSPGALAGFFVRFSTLAGWKRTSSPRSVRWNYHNAKGAVSFEFSRQSGRLTHWQISGSGATVSWNIGYLPVGSVPPLLIPSDAVPVSSFRVPPMRPSFKDSETQHVVNSCFDAYEQAFRFRASISGDSGKFELWRDGASVQELGPTGGWRWSGGVLTVWPKVGPVVEGKCRASRVRSYLGELGVEPEPLALTVLSDNNYAATLFTPDFAVRDQGRASVAGVAQNLLKLTGPGVVLDLAIDQSGMICRMDSTTFDSHGRTMSENVRTLAYTAAEPFSAPPAGPRGRLPRRESTPKIAKP